MESKSKTAIRENIERSYKQLVIEFSSIKDSDWQKKLTKDWEWPPMIYSHTW